MYRFFVFIFHFLYPHLILDVLYIICFICCFCSCSCKIERTVVQRRGEEEEKKRYGTKQSTPKKTEEGEKKSKDIAFIPLPRTKATRHKSIKNKNRKKNRTEQHQPLDSCQASVPHNASPVFRCLWCTLTGF